MVETPQRCRNCKQVVSGEYCSHCGQREGRADRRFLDLAGELTGDLLDFDSRLWRTLIFLLFRPGFLSAEFIAGRRARYLPPLRLYLVISFMVFLVMSMGTSISLSSGEGDGDDLSGDVVVTLDPEEAAQAVTGEEVEDPNDLGARIDLAGEDSPQWLQDVDQRMEENVDKLKEDPGEFVETMVGYLPQMMFILLPVFALLVRVAYLFSPFHYLQHLVFALHYHAFVYLLYLLAQLLELTAMHMDAPLFLGLLVYLPLALRRSYASSWGGALGKSLFLYVGYGIVLSLGFAGVAMLALWLL